MLREVAQGPQFILALNADQVQDIPYHAANGMLDSQGKKMPYALDLAASHQLLPRAKKPGVAQQLRCQLHKDPSLIPRTHVKTIQEW